MTEEAAKRTPRAVLRVNGEEVPMNRFAESALVGVLEGFVASLHDVGPGELQVTIPAERRAERP